MGTVGGKRKQGRLRLPEFRVNNPRRPKPQTALPSHRAYDGKNQTYCNGLVAMIACGTIFTARSAILAPPQNTEVIQR
jgi:hypothetical protein